MSDRITNNVDGIDIILHDHCAFCPDFEVEVEKTDITSVSDLTERTQTWISCQNAEKCVRLKARLEKEMVYERAKGL